MAPSSPAERVKALVLAARQAARGLTLRALLPLMVKRQALPDLLRSLDRPSAPGGDDPRRLAAQLFRPLRLWPTTCLYRALGSYALLRAAGQEVRFVIGVRKAGGELQAHAWLEREGTTIVGALRDEPPYTVAYAWPADPALQRSHPPGERSPGITRSDAAVLTELPDGTGVLLHLQTGYYFTLNATGVRAWKLLDAGFQNPAELASALSAQFPEIEPGLVRLDVEALLADLDRESLIFKEL